MGGRVGGSVKINRSEGFGVGRLRESKVIDDGDRGQGVRNMVVDSGGVEIGLELDIAKDWGVRPEALGERGQRLYGLERSADKGKGDDVGLVRVGEGVGKEGGSGTGFVFGNLCREVERGRTKGSGNFGQRIVVGDCASGDMLSSGRKGWNRKGCGARAGTD
jgi:hypothetical protein